mgnify:CR=1 FL=1
MNTLYPDDVKMNGRTRLAPRGILGLALLGALTLAACDTDAAAGRAGAPDAAAAPAAAPAGPAQAASPTAGVDLGSVGYSRGRADAPMVVYEFSDFGCPFCAKFAQETYPTLAREYVETGKVRWVFVPFVMGMFPNGDAAARAGECAAEQERFWPMHDLLYERQKEWKQAGGQAEALFARYAAELELDAARFASCYREDRGGARTAQNNQAAAMMGIRATPSFVINGRVVEGALPVEQFREVLRLLGSE